MRKIPGVTTVRVSLNDGLTVLDLDAGNTVTLGRLRTVLKNSGLVSREARLEAAGTVGASAQNLVFAVSGTGEKFTVLPGNTNRAAYDSLNARARAGAVAVQLKATANPPDDKLPSVVFQSVE